MKAILDRASLLRALGHVQGIVERRGTIPVLSHVKVEAVDGKLNLTATDMDVAFAETVEAKTEEEGITTVPAHMFYDIVRKLPDGSEITFEGGEEAGKVTIKAGSSRFTLPCLPVKDFPVIAEGEFSHHFTLTASECRELVDKTRFAISTEETRYYLNGIYLHVAQGDAGPVLRAVATDGHRLARTEVTLPTGADGMPGVIVPRKTVSELKKLIDAKSDDVQVAVSDTKIRFVADGAVLVSKLIDGTFPDYQRVIPQQNDRLMELDGRQFSEAVDRVSTVSSDKSRAVKLLIDNGMLNLASDSSEQGSANEQLTINYSSDSMEIGFNSRYLLEMMSQVESDKVQFLLGDATAPALVRDPSDTGALYVIMPMRI